MRVHPVILCGGTGQRLWPLSVEGRPKPFLNLISERSMIEEAAACVASDAAGQVSFAPPMIVGSVRHEAALRRAVPGARLVLEPVSRDSAPAIAAAALLHEPDQLLLTLPADQVIGNVKAFRAAIVKGAARALAGDLVTFGVMPDHPSTAYGYIEAELSSDEVRRALAFVEKPGRACAERYVAGGRHYWNAGIFLFRCRDMVAAFDQHAPDILEVVRAATGEARTHRGNCRDETVRVGGGDFARCRAQSIDYAVMEHAANISVVPVDMDWSDIGDFRALRARIAASPQATLTEGPVVAENVRASYLRSEGPRLAVKDVSDIAVVASRDRVLVVPLASAGAIKPLVTRMAALGVAADLSDTACGAAIEWLRVVLATSVGIARDGGGSPSRNADADRSACESIRVRASEVHAFARAGTLGLVSKDLVRSLISAGLDDLVAWLDRPCAERVKSANGNGRAMVPESDLAAHAFIALAGAAALEAGGHERASALVGDALARIDRRVADHMDGRPGQRSNPDAATWPSSTRMHVLEASLEAFRVTADGAHLDRARAIVELFEADLFDTRSGAIPEHLAQDGKLAGPREVVRVRPGDCYRWATLLALFEEVDGRDLISWRRRLIGFADLLGRDPNTGLALNAVTVTGVVVDADRELVPQLDMLRARFYHPGSAAPGAAESLLKRIMTTFDDRPAAIPARGLCQLVAALAPLAARSPGTSADNSG